MSTPDTWDQIISHIRGDELTRRDLDVLPDDFLKAIGLRVREDESPP